MEFTKEEIEEIKKISSKYTVSELMGEVDYKEELENMHEIFRNLEVKDSENKIIRIIQSEDGFSEDLWEKLFDILDYSNTWVEGIFNCVNKNETLEGFGGEVAGGIYQSSPVVLFSADDGGMFRVYFLEEDIPNLFPEKEA